MFLEDLEILALDCQTTGASPEKGHLLEIGWCRTRASSRKETARPETYLVKLPEETEIPRHVSRVTGIFKEDLFSAPETAAVWKRLRGAVQRNINTNQRKFCTTVIHFSRFEEPFLRQLHEQNEPDGIFPFEIICSHKIIKRLYPHLPRRGLRAVAGYFGHSVPELRRSEDHTVATVFIWRKIVHLLKTTHGIDTLATLFKWMAEHSDSIACGREYPLDKKIRLGLPDLPGVYRMRRSNGDLLYIGKARSLRQRVNSYFQKKRHHAEHTLEMLTQAHQLDVSVSGSALEAAIQESDEIKKFSPPYNIALRDGDRKLVFCSEDFHQFSHSADNLCRIGPLPSQNPLRAFSSIYRLLEGSGSPSIESNALASLMLSISQGYAPEPACLQEGFEVFRKKYWGLLSGNSLCKALVRLGARLWGERLDESDGDKFSITGSGDNESPAADPESNDPQSWTPESITKFVENTIRHVVYLIRRSRWLCMLSESSLTWEPAGLLKKKI
ncbi:exonuclease domain-containing protein [Thermodesulfobacteriota bacterium]